MSYYSEIHRGNVIRFWHPDKGLTAGTILREFAVGYPGHRAVVRMQDGAVCVVRWVEIEA